MASMAAASSGVAAPPLDESAAARRGCAEGPAAAAAASAERLRGEAAVIAAGRIDLMEEIALARLAWMRATGTMLDATLDHACGDVAGGTR
ncbi:hypothetical protein [Sorangium sp. So ce385]|uniref:hypothetical protein n=1 Tax=Sorangium sp. So ce385 TaxID=3133308 RepID=UPI003F5B4B90